MLQDPHGRRILGRQFLATRTEQAPQHSSSRRHTHRLAPGSPRSITFELLALVRDLNERGIEFRSISESLDTSTPAGRLLLHVLASMAEFERSLISERTRAGMAAARARGSRIGRRPAMTSEQLEDARMSIEHAGKTVGEVAGSFQVHPRTLSRLLRQQVPVRCQSGCVSLPTSS